MYFSDPLRLPAPRGLDYLSCLLSGVSPMMVHDVTMVIKVLAAAILVPMSDLTGP